jgi:2-haloacid dehalogenase
MFGDRSTLREWFAQAILYSEAITLSENYAPFGELREAVLNMLAVSRGVRIDEDLQALKPVDPSWNWAKPNMRCARRGT